MDKIQMIEEIKKNVSFYKNFICPDYPDFGIYSKQYMDILEKVFNNLKEPFSLIYTDVNKLSVVNERFGNAVGDRTLHSLLSIFTSNPSLKDSITVRIGGDEFVTFVPKKTREEVEQILNTTLAEVKNKSKEFYGSGLSFGVEDSTYSKNVEKLIAITEHKVDIVKKESRKNDTFLEKAQAAEGFIDLPIPQNISEEQKQKWEVLNAKINIAIDNHLRDLRPSSNKFEYKIPNIKADISQFLTSFRNLLEQDKELQPKIKQSEPEKKGIEITPETAYIMHSLFTDSITPETLSTQQLQDVQNALNTFGKNLICNSHSGLFNKPYYKLFLADKLLDSKQNYQSICFSMSGIRPSNTAYGHSITDSRMNRTIPFLIEAFQKECSFNNEPFTFDKNDSFFVDQGGGNYLAYIPNNKALKKSSIEHVVQDVNSHFTEGKDSTLKIAAASKRNVNRFTIPFFVNSMNNVRNSPIEFSRTLFQVLKNGSTNKLSIDGAPFEQIANKPFVKFAHKLKEICNDNKDSLKMESLSGITNQKSIESVINDLASYYLNEIENPEDIKTKKLLSENVILALSNHEAYINNLNKQLYDERREDRKILKSLHAKSDIERE